MIKDDIIKMMFNILFSPFTIKVCWYKNTVQKYDHGHLQPIVKCHVSLCSDSGVLGTSQ